MSRPLAALALLLATVPTASEAQAWQPTGKWTVDDTETGCVLSREFSADGIGLKFTYRPWLTAAGAGIVLSSTDPEFPKRGPAVATLSPSARTFDLHPPAGPSIVKTEGLTVTSGPDFGGALATATRLRIVVAGRTIDLETGALASPLAALKKCRDDRLRSYGLDPTLVVSVPTERMLGILRPDDYPPSALRAGVQGKAMVAVSFAADGRPVACKIAESSGDRDLDLASCRSGLRLTLDPIGNGQPERWVILPVRWALPG